ncbi:MAG: HAMP domain-containing histidine kinase [Clostridia bacterium]|nr:HAMP domain-containing histidine kinase [Clostridia bacterium]
MVAIYLVVTVLAFLVISYMVSNLMEEFLVTQRTGEQSEEVSRLALELSPSIAEQDAKKIQDLVTLRAQELGGRVLVMDTDAVVQVDSASQQNGFRLPYREVRDVLIGNKESSYGFHSIIRTNSSGEGLLTLNTSRNIWTVYYTAPVTDQGNIIAAVLVSVSIQDVVDSVQDVLQQITWVFLVVAGIIVIVTAFLSGWLTKPILTLTNAIRRMGSRGTGVRVNIKGRGELAELGNAFNLMSEQIEDHDRVRDEFVSNASHELKTPLSTMKILSESILYQDEVDPEMMKEFFLDVNHEVDRLTGVINDLLRLVQEDINESELNYTKLSLDELVRKVTVRLTPLANKKNIHLDTKLAPVTMMADAPKMEQIIMNLVDNAIKYTDEGSVTVTVRSEGGEAVLIVKDTGIGIPEEAIPRLFDRFYRVDKARSRGTGGTGLGLSIVERLIVRHGGYIRVESTQGKGSAFTVRMPLNGGGEA